MKKHIPNLITLMNAVSGSLAIFFAMNGELESAAGLVLLAMVFDFFDGMVARLLHVKSEMGKELDSLADMVSFGVAPAVLAYFLITDVLHIEPLTQWKELNTWNQLMSLTPLLIPALSAYRLAKFNLDLRQSLSFIGMPTPANALFWVGLVFGAAYTPELYKACFDNATVLGLCAFTLSVLLISELPMFSLKISGWGWKENNVRYLYLASLLIITCIYGKAVIFLIIPLYLITSFLAYCYRLITDKDKK